MTGSYDPNRLVTLANGESVPFEQACLGLGTVVSYLEDDSSEWDMVHLLRRACLGQTLDPQQSRALTEEGLLRPDGGIDPVLKAVVLAAVRGEGPRLFLDSPFTDPLDRAMAEYFNAREYIRTRLDAPAAAELLTRDPIQQSFDKYRNVTDPGRAWQDREADRRATPPDELPPH